MGVFSQEKYEVFEYLKEFKALAEKQYRKVIKIMIQIMGGSM
jgi:hypothetical protein